VRVGNVFPAIAFRVLAVSPHSANFPMMPRTEMLAHFAEGHTLNCELGNLLFVCFLAIVVFIAADANAFCHVEIVSW
jgi:hypothetical protein